MHPQKGWRPSTAPGFNRLKLGGEGNPFNSLENKLQLHLDKGTHTTAREVSIHCEKLLWGQVSGQDRHLKVLLLWLFLIAASMPSGSVGAKTKETQRNKTWERTSKRAGISNSYRQPPQTNKQKNKQPSKETRNTENKQHCISKTTSTPGIKHSCDITRSYVRTASPECRALHKIILKYSQMKSHLYSQPRTECSRFTGDFIHPKPLQF